MEDPDSVRPASKRLHVPSENDVRATPRHMTRCANLNREFFGKLQDCLRVIQDGIESSEKIISENLIRVCRELPIYTEEQRLSGHQHPEWNTVEEALSTATEWSRATFLDYVHRKNIHRVRDHIEKWASQGLLHMVQGLHLPVSKSVHIIHDALSKFPEDIGYINDGFLEAFPALVSQTLDDLAQQLAAIDEQTKTIKEFIEHHYQSFVVPLKQKSPEFLPEAFPDMTYASKEDEWVVYFIDPRRHRPDAWEASAVNLIAHQQHREVLNLKERAKLLEQYGLMLSKWEMWIDKHAEEEAYREALDAPFRYGEFGEFSEIRGFD